MTANNPINYMELFEVWADFDDADADSNIVQIIEEIGLGPVDAVSFISFCYGYEKAIQIIQSPGKEDSCA
jgi:hypothetical protein